MPTTEWVNSTTTLSLCQLVRSFVRVVDLVCGVDDVILLVWCFSVFVFAAAGVSSNTQVAVRRPVGGVSTRAAVGFPGASRLARSRHCANDDDDDDDDNDDDDDDEHAQQRWRGLLSYT